jgi:structural maintenance of chromosome 1
MELTHLFEQISGSDAFKRQYDELQQLQAKAEEKVALIVGKKRNIAAEKKQKKEQKEEAERHIAKQQSLVREGQRSTLTTLSLSL